MTTNKDTKAERNSSMTLLRVLGTHLQCKNLLHFAALAQRNGKRSREVGADAVRPGQGAVPGCAGALQASRPQGLFAVAVIVLARSLLGAWPGSADRKSTRLNSSH